MIRAGDDLLEMVVPAVGEGMAVKFMTHKKFAPDLPHCRGPEGNITEPKVKEISAQLCPNCILVL